MADVAATLPLWSTTPGSNLPADATTIGAGLADNLQAIQAIVREWLAHKGSDIVSAATTDLGAVPGLFHDITGSTGPITSFGTVSAGIWKVIKFEGTPTLTHNATSLILPGGANIVAAVGDMLQATSEGSGNWRVNWYTPVAAGSQAILKSLIDAAGDLIVGTAADTAGRLALGTALQLLRVNAGATAIEWGANQAASDTVAGNIEIAIQSEQETGTDVVRAVTPGRQQFHQSAAKAWAVWAPIGGTGAVTADASYNVTSISDDGTGAFTVTIATDFSTANYVALTGLLEAASALGSRINSKLAGSCVVHIFNTISGSLTDATNEFLACYGDQ